MASSGCPENVPQWKRDLIQRRRQQTKIPGCSEASELVGAVQARLLHQETGVSSAAGCGSHRRGAWPVPSGGATSGLSAQWSVAGNMRLETDVSPCCESGNVVNSVKSSASGEERSEEVMSAESIFEVRSRMASTRRTSPREDGESDSSEELQYGPGIVNRLRCKYLNLTLRERNKVRSSVQTFRRAASLEDLLDCDDEAGDKSSSRKYAKRSMPTSKTSDRYREAHKGADTMKRARSVETLLRYNSVSDDVTPQSVPSRFTSMLVSQEPANDHIILIDRTSVKIENRLGELDRPKAANKPKRVKPVLAETERPPPDLVKTTRRLFEGSARKLKPKGEVAVKVATFKTINDTYKAQNAKKIIPKPPLQPKPFSNGMPRPPGSPKKIVPPKIERPESRESLHNDGVITDPIVQSVSSVVSKFLAREKSSSSAALPDSSCKLRSQLVQSPEPAVDKLKPCSENNVRSAPTTPEPRLLNAPLSPRKDYVRQNSSPIPNAASPSPTREIFRQSSQHEIPEEATEHSRQQEVAERIGSPESEPKLPSPVMPEEAEEETVDGPKSISRAALDNIGAAGTTMQFSFKDQVVSGKNYLPGVVAANGHNACEKPDSQSTRCSNAAQLKKSFLLGNIATEVDSSVETSGSSSRLQERLEPTNGATKPEDATRLPSFTEESRNATAEKKPIGAITSLGLMKTTTTTSYPQGNESKTIKCQKSDSPSPPQKQIGIIRPLVSTKTQLPQQNLSNRELEKNLINRVKSIEQPTKVVVSLKSAEEIQPVKKSNSGGGLWDTKPWNQQNNTMVFNFSNRKDVPDYIENDGLIIRRKREKPKVGEGGIIVLDSTLDASSTDEAEWEMTGGPPSPCDVSFLNDNILINGRSNLSKQPRNHKHRIQFDDTATRTFEYPSEASMFEGEMNSVDGNSSIDQSQSQSGPIRATEGRPLSVSPTPGMPSLLGGGGLASYTPSKVDLASEGFELGVTRATVSAPIPIPVVHPEQPASLTEVDYLKPAQDAGAWGSETTADLLF